MSKIIEIEKKIEELKEVLTWCNDMSYCHYLDDDDLVGEQLGAILEIANSASKVI